MRKSLPALVISAILFLAAILALILLEQPPVLRAQSAPLETAPAALTLSLESAPAVSAVCPDLIANEVQALEAQLIEKSGDYERLITAARLSLDFIINNLTQMAFEQGVVESLPLELETRAAKFDQAYRSYDDSLEYLLDFGENCAQQEAAFMAAFQDMISKRQKLEMAAQAIVELISLDFAAAFDELEKKLMEVPQQRSQ